LAGISFGLYFELIQLMVLRAALGLWAGENWDFGIPKLTQVTGEPLIGAWTVPISVHIWDGNDDPQMVSHIELM